MSTLLALETSGRETTAAVLHHGAILFADGFTSGRRETGPLFSLVRSALDSLENAASPAAPLTGLVVGTGPGSYNGLRAGLALAAGLGLALGVPVGGWSSLLGLPLGRWLVCGDARGGQWFQAVVADGVFLEEPHLLAKADAAEHATDRAREFGAALAWVGEEPPSAHWEALSPRAENLARVAAQWLAEQPASLPREAWPPAGPLYLKEPCITVAKAPATQAPLGNPAK